MASGLCISFIRKGDEPWTEVSLEERRSDEGLEVDRDSLIVPGDQEIKELRSNEPLNAKYPEVNEASETPGKTRSGCQITDTDGGAREQLSAVNEKIPVKFRQTETDTIHQAHLSDLETEPEWITKIKTFKITRVEIIQICRKIIFIFYFLVSQVSHLRCEGGRNAYEPPRYLGCCSTSKCF